MRKRIPRAIVSLLLAVSMIAGFCTALAQPASAISSSFFNNHTDWHFDLTKEPNRAMTQEEFVALVTAYSYWAVGTSGTAPVDGTGNRPSAWAAPYIIAEQKKGTITPAWMDYDAPATMAFIMEFTARSKGLSSQDGINIRTYTGTQGLNAEQLLTVDTAVDYGLFPYRSDISVTVPRKDLEAKYLIPGGEAKLVSGNVYQAQAYGTSMAFCEDRYSDTVASQTQLDNMTRNADNFNVASLSFFYINGDASRIPQGNQYVGSSMERVPQTVQLLQLCKNKGITVLGGLSNAGTDTMMRSIAADPSVADQVVTETMTMVDKYGLDGINLGIETSATYRSAYSTLLTKLGAALHAKGKLLYATIGAAARQIYEDQGLYDYSVIAQTVDMANIILYDDHPASRYPSVGVGNLSDRSLIRRNIRYAAAKIGADKVLLSVATYGVQFNTTKKTAANISYQQVMALRQQYNATVKTSDSSADDAYFTYNADGNAYTVYFESAGGLSRRLDMARQYGLAGVACFYLGCTCDETYTYMGKFVTDLPFADVSPANWAYTGVKYAYEHQLFDGVSANHFCPDNAMSRAMLVTVLYRMQGKPDVSSLDNPFSDVSGGWYYNAVKWAAANNIVTGVGHGLFDPNGNVTREQMAAILYRYTAWRNLSTDGAANLSDYVDAATISGWATASMRWAVDQNLIQGIGNSLVPKGSATRAQVATVLMRYMQNILS